MSPDQLASQGARLLAAGYGWSSVSKANARLIRKRADERFKQLSLIEMELVGLPPPRYVTIRRGMHGWVEHIVVRCEPYNALGNYIMATACRERVRFDVHSIPHLLSRRKTPNCKMCLANPAKCKRAEVVAEDIWNRMFRDVLAHLERDNLSPHVLDNALRDLRSMKEELDAQATRETLA